MSGVQVAGSEVCHNHSDRSARWECTSCGNAYCGPCMDEDTEKHPDCCPGCAGFCHELVDDGNAASESGSMDLTAVLAGSFTYPFRGAVPIIAIGVVFFSIVHVLLLTPIPVLGMFFAVIGSGYCAAVMFGVLNSSSQGEERFPWPKFTPFFAVFGRPLVRIVGLTAFCAGPAAACIAGSNATGSFLLALLATLLAFAGAIYYPMAFLSVCLHGSFQGLRPSLVIGGISAIPGPYLLVWFLCVVAIGLCWLLHFPFGFIPIAGWILSRFVDMLGAVLCVRMLGLLYHAYDRRIGWF